MKKEEDDGIFELIDFDYDVDLVKEELEYYDSTYGSRENNEEEADSAVQSARNLPVKKSSHNGFRNSAGVYSICHRAILLKNLYETKLINYRARGEQFILCDERLLSHLLNFIDVPPEVKTDDDPPLFSVMNDAVFVNTRYYFHDSDIRHKYSHSYLCNTASPYLNTHIQLREIIQFISDIVTIEDLAPFWRVFVDFTNEFLEQYCRVINNLSSTKMLNVSGLLLRTTPLRENVFLLHSLIKPFLSSNSWKWKEIEYAWNLLFLATEHSEVLTESQIHLSVSLQSFFYPMLLSTMDYIYSLGNIRDDIGKYFILYSDYSDPEVLITRCPQGLVVSLLWDDDLLDTVLRGAQSRTRLGALVDVCPIFSDAFYNNMRSNEWRDGQFIPFGHLRRSFRAAANQITSELSNQLIKDIRSFGLMEFWSDMKEVTVGRIAHFYASLIYGADASQIVSMDVAQAFYSAVNLSYIPPNRALRWRRVQISEGDHRVECLIERPLNFVINPSFIAVMNDCMNYMFKIYRILEVLTGVNSDRRQCDNICENMCDKYILEKNVRKMCFIVSKLLNLISIIKEVFVTKVYSIFDIYAAFLEQAQTVEEARIAAENAQLELQALVARIGLRKEVHEMIDIYNKLADEIRLKSVSNDLTEDNLSRWEATTLRSIDFLTLMGRHMSKDTVFHALCARLQYSRRRNFLIQQYD